MAQQDLHHPDVDPLGQELGGEGVAKRMGGEGVREPADGPCDVEGEAGGVRGQMIGADAIGEEPQAVLVGLPNLAKHGQCRLGQREGSLLVAFADDPQEHLLGIDGGNGQFNGFAEPQAAGVDEGETAAVNRLPDGGNQATAVLVAADVGKAFAKGQADFFWVNSGQL
jgi:hypothetical protein